MAKANTKKKPEDETLEQGAPEETGDAAEDADEPEPTDEVDAAEPEADEVASEEAVTGVFAPAPVASLNLQHRITMAARPIRIHGEPEDSHALNQLELLTGRLKMSLPAGIAALADGDLKSGLQQLLAML